MPYINDYYPELVRILLNCGEERRPLVLLVDINQFKPRDNDDSEGCKSEILEMFPENSEAQFISMDSWLGLGLKGEEQVVLPDKQINLANLLENESAVCLFLPVLNLLSGLGYNETRKIDDHVFWKQLFIIIDAIPDGAKLLIPAPIRILQLPGFAQQRRALFGKHQCLILEHEDPYCAIRFRMSGNHESHRMATLLIEKKKGPLIFYKLVEPCVKDFRIRFPLLLGGKNQVSSGFVFRGELDPNKTTLFDSYNPDRKAVPNDGKSLGDIAEILRGTHIVANEYSTLKCFIADCITPDLIPDFRKLINVNNVTPSLPGTHLRQGDLVLKSQTDSSGKLVLAYLDEVPSSLLFDQSLIVIRFKPEVPTHTREFVFLILQSPAAARVLFLYGLQPLHDLDSEWVKSLRLPIEDDTVADYLRILQMRNEFSMWTERTDNLLQGLLWEDSPESIRYRIQERDKQLRLIYHAGKSIESTDRLITYYYPRPLSFVWGEYRASVRSDSKAYYERMAKIRKAGETLVAFLTLLAVSYAQQIGTSVVVGHRLSRSGDRPKRGFDFGTWRMLFDAACKKFRKLGHNRNHIPDFGVFLKDISWCSAVAGLNEIRNEDSHLRLSNPELVEKVKTAEAHLNLMFEKVSFLTDWSFRIVDSVVWNSYTKTSKVSFRELHGATIHLETEDCQVKEERLEGGSLYMVNKLGTKRWQLLNPFLLFLECPDHHFESIFYLDSLGQTENKSDEVVLRSFEFNSTISCNAFNNLFRDVGLLE